MQSSSILTGWFDKDGSCEGNRIAKWLFAHEQEMIAASDYIFQHPELAYEETLASGCLAQFMAENGFTIEEKTAGIATAFTATWGSGKPVIAFLAEYDALAQIGHACGHNLLGVGAAAAACAFKSEVEANDPKGSSVTIRLYGCPAEENMSGKIVMNKQHIFDDVDLAVTWHPFDCNRISNDVWMAIDIKNYTFHGISAHAANAPHMGRSALDAAELMNVGVNYLREHVSDDVRMHYAYTNNEIPANVVPDFAKTNYFIRSQKRSRTEDVSRRVDDCARGAALMTGTTVEIETVASCKEMKVNRILTEIYYDAMTRIPTPEYTESELAFAAELTRAGRLVNDGRFFDGLLPLEAEPVPLSVGTDASEVSHVVPLITISGATMCKGTPLHHWTAARQAGMSIGQKGMFYTARCMAEGTKLFLSDPENLKKAWKLHLGTPLF